MTEDERKEIAKAIEESFSEEGTTQNTSIATIEGDDARVWLTASIKLEGFNIWF